MRRHSGDRHQRQHRHLADDLRSSTSPSDSGDRPDPGTVEGHRNAMAEAAETRDYNRRMKELAAEDEAKRPSLLSKVMGFLSSKARR
jgi:hypothetical protein